MSLQGLVFVLLKSSQETSLADVADDRQPALGAGSLPIHRLQVVDLLLEDLDLDLEPGQLAHDAAQGQVEVARGIGARETAPKSRII